MSAPGHSALILRSLDQRLSAVARALSLGGGDDRGAEPGDATSALLPVLVQACRRAQRGDVSWLVLTAAFGGFPLSEEIRAFRRQLEVLDDGEAVTMLLGRVLEQPRRGRLDLEMDVHVGGTVVNVDFCARHDIHTGIHRVVRETLPRWRAEHDVVATANIDQYSALRTLAPRETARVFAHGDEVDVDPGAERLYRARLVVPWRGVLVIPEIPEHAFSPYLAALAEFSGNHLNLVGYDMIPVTSADLRPEVDAARFGRYLTVIKHAHRVAGISVSASAEFLGYARAVGAQGLRGPEVFEVLLPGDVPPPAHDAASGTPSRRPRVLCVGSHEPHKNQRAVLHAAERLWRAGHDFQLDFVGGPGWKSEEFGQHVAALRAGGRSVRDRGRLSDDELWQAYRDATFSVFLSLHEGFGLPVVESLACGTPVVTGDYGSLREIAEAGGCLTVDPRDDEAICAAIERLLTDPATVRQLREEAVRRPIRTWHEYASELWSALGVREPAP